MIGSRLDVGDVVQHRILGSEKVIVGVGEDRYLCAHRDDILGDGRLRPQARVALHRQESLRKIGRHDPVVAVNLGTFYGKEFKQHHRLRRMNQWMDDIIPYFLFLVAAVLIVLAVFSGTQQARKGIEQSFFKTVEGKKLELIKGKMEELEKVKGVLQK